ncbi:MAG: hypothetical protein IPJ05_08830 [Nitrosomonas sp.]|nr:hypothetical protein [Nitrosomonas sp.]
MKGINSIILLIFAYGLIPSTIAGTFLFAEDSETADVITHPQGYRGQGTNLIITVGISPSSLHGTEITLPIQNAITTWNQLIPTLGNIVNDEKIPFNHFDFESVVLHELGHCLGLAHPNLSSESGLSGVNRNYTQTTRGSNNRYDLNSGNDGVAGSNDDSRGDDINLHWFRKKNNNPFTIAEKIDITTYSRNLVDLPAGHTFAANGDRTVANLLGYQNTEAVMQQGIIAGEAQRTLTADDIATLKLAMSGLDRFAGTPDDYTLTLEFIGFTDNADIVVSFNNSRSSFAVCETRAELLNLKHFVITRGRIYFNANVQWYFNDLPSPNPPKLSYPSPTIAANNQIGTLQLSQNDTLVLTASLDPGVLLGNPAEYWVRAITPTETFWLNDRFEFIPSAQPLRAHVGEFNIIDRFIIMKSSLKALQPGNYSITFAVDDNQDGIANATFHNTVNITITP